MYRACAFRGWPWFSPSNDGPSSRKRAKERLGAQASPKQTKNTTKLSSSWAPKLQIMMASPATTFSVLDRSCYYRRPSSTFTVRAVAAPPPVLTEEGELSMRTTVVAFAIVITVTLTAAPGFAHHSDVAYDQAKRTTLKDVK